MQVFKLYFKIFKQNLFSILVYTGLFVGILVMISLNIRREEEKKFTSKEIPILVVNEDGNNNLIEGFLNYLDAYVTYVPIENDEEKRKDALFYNEVYYILTIPAGFSEAFLSGNEVELRKECIPNAAETVFVDTAINDYFNMAKVYRKHMPNLSIEELNFYIENNLDVETSVAFNDNGSKNVHKGSDNYYMTYFNTLGYILLACFVTGVSHVLLAFNQLDIRRRNSAAPISNRSINIQLILANLVFVLSYVVVFFVIGYLFNPNKVIGMGTYLYWLNTIVFALVTLSISYIIGNTVTSKNAIHAIATALSLGLAFISGMFVPQEFLGKAVLRLASFTPAYWFVKANDTIALMSNYSWENIRQIYLPLGIQLGFAAAIISMSLVISKRKSQQAS